MVPVEYSLGPIVRSKHNYLSVIKINIQKQMKKKKQEQKN